MGKVDGRIEVRLDGWVKWMVGEVGWVGKVDGRIEVRLDGWVRWMVGLR